MTCGGQDTIVLLGSHVDPVCTDDGKDLLNGRLRLPGRSFQSSHDKCSAFIQTCICILEPQLFFPADGMSTDGIKVFR